MDGTELETDMSIMTELSTVGEGATPRLRKRGNVLKRMLSDPVLKKNLAGANIAFVCCMFNAFLITFYLKYIPGNIYHNNFFFAGSDILAFIISGVFLHCYGVVFGMRASSLAAAVGGVAYILVG